MRILAFYHILLINHFIEIVTEQLNLLVASGLYDEMQKMYVGCLGEKSELEKLKKIFEPYPKISIEYHSTNIHEFEFATLKILKEKADNESSFYGFYFHGKGVSWPKERRITAFIGGTYWRHYMNYYGIRKWRDNIKRLDEGYDTCGVKLIPATDSPAYSLHYSGNYGWFKSEYVKTLIPIERLNHEDRFKAEFWLCSNNAKAATLCQDFIDYTAKGKFIPPHE
jgi:hypothetical protein